MSSNISVEEFTSPSIISATPQTTLAEAEKIMKENGIRHLLVLDNKKVVGILSERDLSILSFSSTDMDLEIQDFMKTNVYVTEPSTPLHEVAFEMSKSKIGSAVIYSEKEDFLGIFTSTDALNALLEILRGDENS